MIAEAIREQLVHLSKEIAETEILLEPVATQCSKTDPQRAELMQHQELIYKHLSVTKKRYNALLLKEKQIDDEAFGLCSVCDEAISFERLLLLPESELCVACANEKERR